MGTKLTILIGKLLYEFATLQQWKDHALEWSDACEVPACDRIAIDSTGRVCTTGSHFERASIDCTYPIVVFSVT